MSPHPLHTLFFPQHLAVVGASDRPGSFGERVLSALLAQPFDGLITPVNPRHKAVAGLPAVPHLGKLLQSADTALILTRPDSYDAVLKACVKNRIGCAAILLRPEPLDHEQTALLEKAVAAYRHRLRLLVCTAAGFGNPAAGLQATLCRPLPAAGQIAVIGSEQDFGLTVADCLHGLPLGFSLYVNLAAPYSPLDAADLAGFFAEDPHSRILIVQYAAAERAAEWFSALRLAARRQTVLLYLSGQRSGDERAQAAQLAERCGLLLCQTPAELQAAVRAAAAPQTQHDGSLSVLSNGDTAWLHREAEALGLELHDSPVRIERHAGALQFRDAAAHALQDGSGGLLLLPQESLHAPAADTARQLRTLTAHEHRPVYLVCPRSDGLNSFPTARAALQSHAARLRLQQLKDLDRQSAPPPLAPRHTPDPARARRLLHDTGAVLAALHLPPLHEDGSGAQLHYRRHPHTGPVLDYRLPGGSGLLLPPFDTRDAVRLSSCAAAPLQADFEQLLHSLNAAAYALPELHALSFSCRPDGLSGRMPEFGSAGHTLPLLAGVPEYTAHCLLLKNGRRLNVRPIRPEDAEAMQQFIRSLSDEARKTRFMLANKELSPQMLARFCNLDYRREAAFAAFDDDGNMLGLAQHGCTRYPESCEFGISVADSLNGQGAAKQLMACLIDFAREQGYLNMDAEILARNSAMLGLAQALGFTVTPSHEDKELCVANLPLQPPQPAQKKTAAQ